METYTLKTIARLRCDLPDKFGLPRQAGLVEELEGRIVFEPEYRNADALRGIEGFSHVRNFLGGFIAHNARNRKRHQ